MSVARDSPVPLGKLMDNNFPVKVVLFPIPYFIITPLFVLSTVFEVYGVVMYCFVVVFWHTGVL